MKPALPTRSAAADITDREVGFGFMLAFRGIAVIVLMIVIGVAIGK